MAELNCRLHLRQKKRQLAFNKGVVSSVSPKLESHTGRFSAPLHSMQAVHTGGGGLVCRVLQWLNFARCEFCRVKRVQSWFCAASTRGRFMRRECFSRRFQAKIINHRHRAQAVCQINSFCRSKIFEIDKQDSLGPSGCPGLADEASHGDYSQSFGDCNYWQMNFRPTLTRLSIFKSGN